MSWFLAVLLLLAPAPHTIQAHEKIKEGRQLMSSEKFEEAAQAFREAIALDPLLTMAHYGLGQARMALKQYPSAVIAFRGAREAFEKRTAENLTRRLEDDSVRQDRIRLLRDKIRQIQDRAPASQQAARMQQQRIQEWEVEIATLQPQGVGAVRRVPAGITLALGSAHFRSGQMAEAEREYRAVLAADPRMGEPRNNLAVVLLLTGRPAEAREQLKVAEKNGFKVSAGLKKDVETALDTGAPTQPR